MAEQQLLDLKSLMRIRTTARGGVGTQLAVLVWTFSRRLLICTSMALTIQTSKGRTGVSGRSAELEREEGSKAKHKRGIRPVSHRIESRKRRRQRAREGGGGEGGWSKRKTSFSSSRSVLKAKQPSEGRVAETWQGTCCFAWIRRFIVDLHACNNRLAIRGATRPISDTEGC